MTQAIDNSNLISDLLDERISSKELNELLGKEGINESFYRYNAVSKVLRDEFAVPTSMDFVNSVSQKLEAEPSILVPSTKSSHSQTSSNNVVPLFSKIKKLSGGMAIAASVAVATFVSVQSVQVAQDGETFNNEMAAQNSPTNVITNKQSIELASQQLESTEQKQLEFFNDMFMIKARQSEQDAIAPFARAVRGQSVGTIRFSKEQWENILSRSTRTQENKNSEDKNPEEKKQNNSTQNK